MNIKKIIRYSMYAIFCIFSSFVFAQDYDSLYKKAKEYEANGEMVYALGYYYDAIEAYSGDNCPAQKDFNQLSESLKTNPTGRKAMGEWDDPDIEWKNVTRNFYKYFSEFCPYEIVEKTITPGEVKKDFEKKQYTCEVQIGLDLQLTKKYMTITDVFGKECIWAGKDGGTWAKAIQFRLFSGDEEFDGVRKNEISIVGKKYDIEDKSEFLGNDYAFIYYAKTRVFPESYVPYYVSLNEDKKYVVHLEVQYSLADPSGTVLCSYTQKNFTEDSYSSSWCGLSVHERIGGDLQTYLLTASSQTEMNEKIKNIEEYGITVNSVYAYFGEYGNENKKEILSGKYKYSSRKSIKAAKIEAERIAKEKAKAEAELRQVKKTEFFKNIGVESYQASYIRITDYIDSRTVEYNVDLIILGKVTRKSKAWNAGLRENDCILLNNDNGHYSQYYKDRLSSFYIGSKECRLPERDEEGFFDAFAFKINTGDKVSFTAFRYIGLLSMFTPFEVSFTY